MGSLLDRMLVEEQTKKPSLLDTMLTQPAQEQPTSVIAKNVGITPDMLKQTALDSPNADPLWKQGALALTQNLLSVPAALSRTLGHVITPLNSVADKLDEYVAGLTPTQSGQNPNTEAIVQTLGTVAGESASNIVGFEGAKLAARGLGAAAKLAAPELAASALSSIAKAGRLTELTTGQILNASDAARLGNAVIALPTNVAAGLGLQAGIDPSSLATPSGLAKGLGFSVLGSLMEAKDNTNYIARKPKYVDPDLPPANQRAQAVIQQEADVKAPDLIKAAQDFRTNVFDRLNPIKIFSDVVLGDTSLHDAAQLLTNGANSRVSEMINKGTKGAGFADLTNQTAGLTEILASLSPKEAAAGGHLDQYLLSRRVLDEGVQNKISENLNRPTPKETVPLSTTDATQIVANAPQHIIDAADGITGFMNSVKEYGVKSGVLKQELLDQLDAQNPNYIPLKREVNKIIDPSLKPIDNTFGAGKVIQKLFGSQKDVLSPVNNVRDFAGMVMKTADRNTIGLNLLDAINGNSAASEALGVRRITGADKFSDPQFYKDAEGVKDRLAQEGVHISENLSQQLIGQFGKNYDPKTNVLTVQTANGLERLQLNSDLAKTFKSLAPQQMGMLTQMLSIPAKVLRTGTTAALDFSLVNLMRDSWDSAMQGQYGFKAGRDPWSSLPTKLTESFKNTGKGFAEAIKQGQTYSDFRSAGGDFGDVNRLGSINPNNVFNDIRPTTLGTKVGNVIMHPIDALKEVARPFEEAARIGEFISNREHGASLQESGLAARNVTTDFQQRGASQTLNALTQMTSFLNPAIQSLDRNYQVFMNDKTGVAAKGLAAISLPTMALWAANHGDKEIADLRKTPAGSTYWFVRAGDNIIRIPKPFLYGQVFGTIIENALDKIVDQDPNAGKRLVSAITDQAGFNMIPNAISVPLQLKLNKDIYTGGSIIPDALKNVDPQTQVTLGTSQLAQHISGYLYHATGGNINVSPIQLDWLAKNTGGNVAKDIMNVYGDHATLADYPFFRRFVAQYPSSNVEPIQTFYNNADKFNGVVQTVNKMARSNTDPQTINNYLSKHANEYAYASTYAEAQKQLRDIQQTIWQIHTAPETAFSKEAKKKMIDQMYGSAIEIARGVNHAVQGN